jgi:CBS domain containing-hemolysin-like protein
MASDRNGDKPDSPAPYSSNGMTAASADDAKALGPGWLSSLRAKLGLQGAQTLRDTIEGALKQEAATSSAFSAEERQMMLRMLRFGALRVADIMVPRADIIALEETEPLSELLRTFEEGGISRIPMFNETLDDPRGMVHIKDVLAWLIEAGGVKRTEAGSEGAEHANPGADPDAKPRADPFPATPHLDLTAIDLSRPVTVAKIRRPVLFVPPSMPVMNLLIRMQSTRIHMALVVDEYGGTDGLVTIEDLVEQVVGDIEDEHDEAEAAHITRDAKGVLSASARTPIAELESMLGRPVVTQEEAEEVDTLGGLVFSILGRVPVRGEIVRHEKSGLEFEVLDADPRRVKKLRIDPSRLAGPPLADPGSPAKA